MVTPKPFEGFDDPIQRFFWVKNVATIDTCKMFEIFDDPNQEIIIFSQKHPKSVYKWWPQNPRGFWWPHTKNFWDEMCVLYFYKIGDPNNDLFFLKNFDDPMPS